MRKDHVLKVLSLMSTGKWPRLKETVFFVLGIVFLFALCIPAYAASADIMRYQVVSGSDDKAYLVDTTTGAVWVLTYRTLATGREPIAIPYKFIKYSPKNYKEFIVENVQDVPIPSGEK